MSMRSLAAVSRTTGMAGLLVLLTACQTVPTVRTQSAPGVDLTKYHTYEFFDKPGTDRGGYTSITTRSIETAVERELTARGLVRGPNPDLKIDFNIAKRDKVAGATGPRFSVGFGGWRSGYNMGVGVGTGNDISTKTEGTLTVDLVDVAKNELVWSGSASRTLNAKVLDQPAKAIDQAVTLIFAKYPVGNTGATATSPK